MAGMEGAWTCDRCTFDNQPSRDRCGMCWNSRPKAGYGEDETYNFASDYQETRGEVDETETKYDEPPAAPGARTSNQRKPLAVGDFVKIHGLQSERGRRFNGQSGKIIQYYSDRDRFDVKLDGSDETVAVKPQNLNKKVVVECMCSTHMDLEMPVNFAAATPRDLFCEGCYEPLREYSPCYHCSRGEEEPHTGGFNLCIQCGTSPSEGFSAKMRRDRRRWTTRQRQEQDRLETLREKSREEARRQARARNEEQRRQEKERQARLEEEKRQEEQREEFRRQQEERMKRIQELNRREEQLRQQEQQRRNSPRRSPFQTRRQQEVSCFCGRNMTRVSAGQAYANGGGVICDGCRGSVRERTMIYHCPAGRIERHRAGYDLCLDCARNPHREAPLSPTQAGPGRGTTRSTPSSRPARARSASPDTVLAALGSYEDATEANLAKMNAQLREIEFEAGTAFFDSTLRVLKGTLQVHEILKRAGRGKVQHKFVQIILTDGEDNDSSSSFEDLAVIMRVLGALGSHCKTFFIGVGVNATVRRQLSRLAQFSGNNAEFWEVGEFDIEKAMSRIQLSLGIRRERLVIGGLGGLLAVNRDRPEIQLGVNQYAVSFNLDISGSMQINNKWKQVCASVRKFCEHLSQRDIISCSVFSGQFRYITG